MCTIQEQSSRKSSLEGFLSNSQNQKKLDPFSMQILLGCVDSILDSILFISNFESYVNHLIFEVPNFAGFPFLVSILKQELKKSFNESSRKYSDFSGANGILGIDVR